MRRNQSLFEWTFSQKEEYEDNEDDKDDEDKKMVVNDEKNLFISLLAKN